MMTDTHAQCLLDCVVIFVTFTSMFICFYVVFKQM